jgi:ABC-2 type transport system ATP-binding protein
MSAAVVRIEGLTKRLRRGVLAVDGLNLVVERGQVVGLTGPNGSGKSVTLRILLGLVRPSAGRVWLFGEPVRPGAPALGRVGALVDGPGFVPHLSGYENLRLAWRLMRRRDEDWSVDRVLEIGGLGNAIHRPYSTYSHGMRYRLALAQALLGRPQLLVLDEPTTGLDPVHIREIHQVIAEVARDGATVLFASHLLGEVEHICTHAAVMQGGRLVATGTVQDLIGSTCAVALEVNDTIRALKILRGFSGTTRVTCDGPWLLVDGPALRPFDLFTALAAAGVEVRGFHRGRTLEAAYIELVDETKPLPVSRDPELTIA